MTNVNASNVLALIIAMVGINVITEMIASGILGTAIAKPIDMLKRKNSI